MDGSEMRAKTDRRYGARPLQIQRRGTKDRILKFLDRPKSLAEIDEHIGRSAYHTLSGLVWTDSLVRLGDGKYLCKDRVTPDMQVLRKGQHLAPIQDQIFDFLAIEHSAKEVSLHIGRSVETATGQLCAMVRKNRIRRISRGRYIRVSPSVKR